MEPTLHHLIIPYAATSRHLPGETPPALPALPRLTRLLSRLQAQAPDAGDEYSLSPPHERAWAQALGWPCQDGTLPWAAWHAQKTGTPCAWFTPCHWQTSMDQVTLQPVDGHLSAQESQVLLAALQTWATEDGIELFFETPTRWRAESALFAGLPCASWDRVVHRTPQVWLPDTHQAGWRTLWRLQNEAQMLFYQHPLHDQRQAQGLPSVNGFWISGAGSWDGQTPKTPPVVEQGLRAAALQGNMDAWAKAWLHLDENVLPLWHERLETGQAVRITLCGERHAQTWSSPPSTTPQFKTWLSRWWPGKRAPKFEAILREL